MRAKAWEVHDPEAWIWWSSDRTYCVTWDDRFTGVVWQVSHYHSSGLGVRSWDEVDLPLSWEWV